MGSGKAKVIEVECANCGQELARYNKVPGKGTLIKMFVSEILKDRTEEKIFSAEKYPTGHEFFCPSCEQRIGVLQLVHGKPAVEIDRGHVRPERVG